MIVVRLDRVLADRKMALGELAEIVGIEADHESQRGDRVPQGVLREQPHDDVEDDRSPRRGDGGHRRRLVAGRDATVLLRQRAVVAHRQDGPRGRDHRRLQRGQGGREHCDGDEHREGSHDGAGERGEDRFLVVRVAGTEAFGG